MRKHLYDLLERVDRLDAERKADVRKIFDRLAGHGQVAGANSSRLDAVERKMKDAAEKSDSQVLQEILAEVQTLKKDHRYIRETVVVLARRVSEHGPAGLGLLAVLGLVGCFLGLPLDDGAL